MPLTKKINTQLLNYIKTNNLTKSKADDLKEVCRRLNVLEEKVNKMKKDEKIETDGIQKEIKNL